MGIKDQNHKRLGRGGGDKNMVWDYIYRHISKIKLIYFCVVFIFSIDS